MIDLLQDKKILVVDNDPADSQFTEMTFRGAGAHVLTANNGREGLRMFYEHRPDLVILDVLLPDIDGFEACQQMRLMSSTPIIILTTLQNDNDVVQALNSGADDFLSKPFVPEVLLARTRAIIRRSIKLANTEPEILHYNDGYLTIEPQYRHVKVNGELVHLTSIQFQLLFLLLERKGSIVTYQEILEKIWGENRKEHVEYVHVYMFHLRRKIERKPRYPEYLLTEHGVGYRFHHLNQG
jgi:two-component system, OmpR family, KDP operon response regulator KdpE